MERLDACPSCRARTIVAFDDAPHLSRCSSCGLVFDNPRPTFEELRQYYSRPGKYDSWLREEKARDALWQRRLTRVRRHVRGGALLDVGAGIGQFLFFARQYFAVEGTEVSASAIALAREKYGLQLRAGALESIDFGGRQFDVITVFHVLEHVGDPGALLRTCRGLLAPGGTLIVAVPNELNRFSLLSLAQHPWAYLRRARQSRCGDGMTLNVTPRIDLTAGPEEVHLVHFTEASLRALIARNGLRTTECSLDPYYASSGGARACDVFKYGACALVRAVGGVNYYDALWLAAKVSEAGTGK